MIRLSAPFQTHRVSVLVTIAGLVLGLGVWGYAQNLRVVGSTTHEGDAYFYSNVGIGTTAPARRFAVFDAGPRFYVGSDAISTWTTPIRLQADTTGANYNQIQTMNGHLAITGAGTATGNVGIGTTSPGAMLDVNTSFEDGLVRFGRLMFRNRASGTFGSPGRQMIHTVSGEDLRLGASDTTSPVDHVTIQHGSGNVGIGTTAPAQRLHVAGTVRADGFERSDGAPVGGPILHQVVNAGTGGGPITCNATWQTIGGLTKTITVAAPSRLKVTASAMMISSSTASKYTKVFLNGGATYSSYGSSSSPGNFSHTIVAVLSVGAGTHTLEMRGYCDGGNFSADNSGVLTIEVFPP